MYRDDRHDTSHRFFWRVALGGMTVAILGGVASSILLSLWRSRATVEGPADASSAASVGYARTLSDGGDRMAEIERIVQMQRRDALPILAQYARRDKDVEFRLACIRAIGGMGDARAAHALAFLADSPGERREIRLASIAALGAMPAEVPLSHLKSALTDEDASLRLAAVQAVSRRDTAEAVGLLAQALKDESQAVRAAAVAALAGKATAEATEQLLHALGSLDPKVRQTAVAALGRRGGPAIHSALARAASDPDEAVRAEAVRSVRGADAAALDALIAGAGPRAALSARIEVAQAIRRQGSAKHAAALLRLLNNLGPRCDGGAAVQPLRQEVLDGLLAMGEQALAPVLAAALDGECDALAERVAADVCRRIGKAAVAPIVAGILKWKLFPDPDELKLWIEVLGDLGDPAAADALNFALGQGHAGLEPVVAEARAAIEKKSGVKLPPPVPVRALPEPAGGNFARLPSARRVPDSPSTEPTDRIPDEGILMVTLRGALFQMIKEQRGNTVDLQLHLQRRDGRWMDPCWSHGHRYNARYHPCRVVACESGDPLRLRIDVFILDDQYVSGGHAEYEVALKREEGGWSGAYTGQYNGVAVNGGATADCRKGRIVPLDNTLVVAGEHPRLLFRISDLPALRARAQTDFGRAVVLALLKLVAEGKADDDAGKIDSMSWFGTSPRALAMAFLAHLYDDPELAKRAARTFMLTVRTKPYQGEHGSLGPIAGHGVVYDMVHPLLTPEERREATRDLAWFWGYSSVEVGMIGNMTGGSPPEGYAALGPAALALLREPGPMHLVDPSVRRVFTIEADGEAGRTVELSPNEFAGDTMLMTHWLLAGPLPPEADAGVLTALGGPARARPAKGTKVSLKGVEVSFAPLPASAVRPVSGFGRKAAYLSVPGAGPGSKTFLYGLLKAELEQSVFFDCTFPVDFDSARVWISGVALESQATLRLKPGLHPVLIELAGSRVSPYVSNVTDRSLAQERKNAWRGEFYRAAKAKHEKDGELAGVGQWLAWATHATRDVLRIRFEEHLRLPTIHYGGFGKWPTFFANSYQVVTGEPLSRDTPWDFDLRPELIRTLSDADLCHALKIASEPVKPFVVDEFNRRFPADKLSRLGAQSLIVALANYPLDVKPQQVEELQARIRIDRQRGIYAFSNGRSQGNVSVLAFTRNVMPRHPTHYMPRAGCFCIHAGGHDLVTNLDVPYDAFLELEGNAGTGPARVTFEAVDPKAGTAILALDTSRVYGADGNAAIKAERHVAVDLSGRCGAPLLVAVLDRIQAPGKKSWSLPTGVRTFHYGDEALRGERIGNPVPEVVVDGTLIKKRVDRPRSEWFDWRVAKTKTETITRGEKDLFGIVAGKEGKNQEAVTLLGRFAAPAEPRVDFDVRRIKSSEITLRAVSNAEQAEYFVVMTVQTGAPPQIRRQGEGLDAVVTVGGQEVRFDDKKLVLKR